MLKGAQEYSGVFRNAQGYSARAILEAPGGPKRLIFAYSSSGFTVFEKPRISRKQVAKLLLRFWEIRKCCFCQQVQCLCVFSSEKMFFECSVFVLLEALWGPKGLISADSSFGFAVFKKARFSRKLEATFISTFWGIRRCGFCPQV